MSDAQSNAVWVTFPDESFLRYRPDQIAWQTAAIGKQRTATALVLARPLAQGGAPALEVFVYAPDSDGLFAAVVATLARFGLSILASRHVNAHNGIDRKSVV